MKGDRLFAVFDAFLLLIILNFTLQPLTEPDFGWHLRTGLDLLWQGGTLPALDPYSHTMPDWPWVEHAWLTDLIVGAFYQMFGACTEQEYPVTLFLGWTTHAQPGYRRDNWSLLEFVLLDLKHNQMLMQAEGRGWATLDRPSAPGIDQWYPAIYLRPQDQRRIWPPTYEGAPNTLRVVSFEQAAKRLVLRLQNSWLGVLEAESAARRASS
ncbi:MAG: hypothetical protein E8D51_01845 [Nitrospira sp.]|nr:MAG: hypothetical protein E8D51_01845 [Nitrospira sp.]